MANAKLIQKDKEIDRFAVERIGSELRQFQQKYSLTFDEAIELIKEESLKKEAQIPLSIFSNDKLSCLESITKFLREEKELTFSGIANLLGRNEIPIGITYRNSKIKMPEKLKIISKEIESSEYITTTIFQNTNLSVLETIILELKKQGLGFHEIAIILNRDDRTIWTCNNRAEKKLEKLKRQEK